MVKRADDALVVVENRGDAKTDGILGVCKISIWVDWVQIISSKRPWPLAGKHDIWSFGPTSENSESVGKPVLLGS